MRKYLSFLLCCCMLIAMGLPGIGHAEAVSAPLQVVSTIFPPYDFVRQIAGEHVQVTMLLPPGSECHSFEPSPQDIILIQNCDVFLYIGGETDAWVARILESMDTSGMTILPLLDMVDAVPEALVEGMEAGHEPDDHDEHDDGDHAHDEHDHGHEAHEALDEHVWTSPKNAKQIVSHIADTLAALNPANADTYAQNAQAYLAELSALDAAYADMVRGAQRTTVVFGDRFPFRYLADDYGLTYYAAFPGCATETEASVATVAFLIDKVAEEALPAVFHIEFSNGKMATTIAESTGTRTLLLHSCHNVTRDEFAAGVGYVDLMWQNLDALKEALY